MSKVITSILVILLLTIITSQKVETAKKFVPKRKTVSRTSTRSIPASVRYRSDRLGILLSFLNFNGIESVSYSFTYNTNGMPQGAGGTITAANNPTAQRELLFGTCSGGVCRYHYNLSDARLTLKAKLTNGKTVVKTYRIKTYQ